MIVIIGSIRLPPENLDAARPVMSRMVTASRAEEGCEEYSYAEDVLEPGLIRVTERSTDQVALDRHFKTEHITEWRSAWPSLGIRDRNLVAYTVVHPQPT